MTMGTYKRLIQKNQKASQTCPYVLTFLNSVTFMRIIIIINKLLFICRKVAKQYLAFINYIKLRPTSNF